MAKLSRNAGLALPYIAEAAAGGMPVSVLAGILRDGGIGVRRSTLFELYRAAERAIGSAGELVGMPGSTRPAEVAVAPAATMRIATDLQYVVRLEGAGGASRTITVATNDAHLTIDEILAEAQSVANDGDRYGSRIPIGGWTAASIEAWRGRGA